MNRGDNHQKFFCSLVSPKWPAEGRAHRVAVALYFYLRLLIESPKRLLGWMDGGRSWKNAETRLKSFTNYVTWGTYWIAAGWLDGRLLVCLPARRRVLCYECRINSHMPRYCTHTIERFWRFAQTNIHSRRRSSKKSRLARISTSWRFAKNRLVGKK